MACLGHMPLTHKSDSSGQQYELLDWLTEVTFPMETRFADVDFARRALRVDRKTYHQFWGAPMALFPL
jgi:hypothetical protein